jgi:4-diphosphocytidyl-2-C-methyl-D-erythritol kinase
MNSLVLHANAKINFGLEILNKRNDGYHNINSIFLPICLSDELIITESPDLIIKLKPDLGIPVEENLVYKAAIELKKAFDITESGANILIKKNIPIGAGLGGGSSDAATVLIGLAKIWNINIEPSQLLNLAVKLGSDIPFFLRNTPAIVNGRGEQLEFFEYSLPYWILLVYPKINISTAWAYKSLKRTESKVKSTNFKKLILESQLNHNIFRENIKNDFEGIVFENYPEISQIKDSLYGSGAVFALLSGSGSSVYGMFDDYELCIRAEKIFSDYFTFICPPILKD